LVINETEDEVRQASERFYVALNSVLNGGLRPMVEVWSHGSDVSVMHPFGDRALGWEEVRASWEQATQAFSDGQAALDDLVVVPIADDAAYTLGTEPGQAKLGGESVRIDWSVTNIYRREGGGWKVVHHHTDLSPAVVDALERLEG
jgi:ketosteroid isomerase-like protein